MDAGSYTDINAETIGRWVDEGWEWGTPIDHETYRRASAGDWQVLLTPTRPVPRTWFGELEGARVLGLASGGGQQCPIFAAAGAQVTVLDYTPAQLESELLVAEREGYPIACIRADMTRPLPFPDESFDLVFNPVSLCYVREVEPIWREAARVLVPGGSLLTGFDTVINYIVDKLNGVVGEAYAEPQGRITIKLPASAVFSDVNAGDWFEAYLQDAYDEGIIGGFPDGTYRPNGQLTHAQIMVMAAQLHSKQKGDNYDFQAAKKEGGAWYQPYEDYCVAEGIVPAETFGAGGPFEGEENTNVTRGQMAFYFSGTLTDESYKDKKEVSLSDIDGYIFKENIEKLAKADIVGGFPDGTFRPDELVTRAQAAVFIKNLLDAIE